MSEINSSFKPVRVKELEVGRIYVNGTVGFGSAAEGHRCAWVYLGRNSKTTEFVWMFVGDLKSEKDILESIELGNKFFEFEFSRTAKNKMVSRLVYFLEARNFKLNLNNVSENVIRNINYALDEIW